MLPPGGLPAVQNVVIRMDNFMQTDGSTTLPVWAVAGLREVFAALPGMRHLLIEPSLQSSFAGERAKLKCYLPTMVQVASLAVQQQLAWLGGQKSDVEEDADAGVAGEAEARRGGCLHSLFFAASSDLPHRWLQHHVTADSTAVTSALWGLAVQCAKVRAESAAAAAAARGKGAGQAGVHIPLRVFVRGGGRDVMEACHAVPEAVAVTGSSAGSPIMLAW